ncbi:MAG: LptF/LptG family permease [Acidobacteriota bacterium]|nr:LptF/LptG family permease [Acidobacteriota bacterium]
MSRIDRYVVTETLGPITLGFVVATFMLLIRAFFELAEAIIRRGVEPESVLKLLALNLPHIVVITIPMAMLFGILVAIGRLAGDSELTALRAAGVSLFYLYRGLLGLSLIFTIGNVALMMWLLPWGNQTYTRLLLEQMTGSITEQLEPRVFSELIPDKTLYVFEVPPGENRWKGVFMADSLPTGETSFTVADTGRVRVEDGGARIIIELENALQQNLDLRTPAEAEVSLHEVMTLAPPPDEERDLVPRTRGSRLREASWSQLAEMAEDADTSETYRALARVEMHKKFSIPFACLVFGLVAVPVGFSRRRGGRSSAFAQSIAIIAVYYVMQNVGEESAADGSMEPWLAMWLPNLLFLAGGAFLVARKNSDKSVILGNLDRWVRQRVAGLFARPETAAARSADGSMKHVGLGEGERPALQGRGASTTRFSFRLPDLRVRFPNRLDRYLLRIFTRIGLLVLAASIVIYIVVDLTELARDIMENDVSSSLVLEHYQYFSLQILYLIAPIAVLLTTLVTFGVLTRFNEITAARALGVSLYRLSLPVIAAGILVVVGAAYLDYAILPSANSRKTDLRHQIKGYEDLNFRRVTHQWFFSQEPSGDSFIFNFLHYNPEQGLLLRFQTFRFDRAHRLTGHLYAEQVQRDEDRWIMRNGWSRSFEGARVADYRDLPGPVALDLALTPNFFSTEIKSSDEMNYLELRDYIAQITSSGQEVPDLKTQLARKISTPVTCLVMVLVALPFAFRMGRRGALYGVGVAILLGITLFVITAFFSTLGEVGALPAWMAAWAPNVLFSLFSLYLFLGVRT